MYSHPGHVPDSQTGFPLQPQAETGAPSCGDGSNEPFVHLQPNLNVDDYGGSKWQATSSNISSVQPNHRAKFLVRNMTVE